MNKVVKDPPKGCRLVLGYIASFFWLLLMVGVILGFFIAAASKDWRWSFGTALLSALLLGVAFLSTKTRQTEFQKTIGLIVLMVLFTVGLFASISSVTQNIQPTSYQRAAS